MKSSIFKHMLSRMHLQLVIWPGIHLQAHSHTAPWGRWLQRKTQDAYKLSQPAFSLLEL